MPGGAAVCARAGIRPVFGRAAKAATQKYRPIKRMRADLFMIFYIAFSAAAFLPAM